MRSPSFNNLIQIASFAVGTGAQAAIGFLSIPLLVRLLGTEELGRWSVIEVVFQVGAQIALLGFNQTIIKFISSDGMAPWGSLLAVVKNLLPVIAFMALATGLFAHFWLGLSPVSATGAGTLLCLECCIVLALSTSRAAKKPMIFSAALITRAASILLALSLAVFVFPKRIDSAANVVWMWSAAYLPVVIFAAFCLSRNGVTSPAPDRAALLNGLKYGAPLMITILIAQSLQYADRFLVAGILGYAKTGQYFIHTKVANTLALASLPIQLWWPTARFTHLKDSDDGRAFFSRASLMGVGFFTVTLLTMALLCPRVFRWFAPTVEFDVLLLSLLLCAVYIQASAIFFNVALLDAGSTHLNIVVWCVTALIQISLQAALVPFSGPIGAAWGLVAGAICSLILQCYLSQKRRRIEYPWPWLLAFLAVAMIGSNLVLRSDF